MFISSESRSVRQDAVLRLLKENATARALIKRKYETMYPQEDLVQRCASEIDTTILRVRI